MRMVLHPLVKGPLGSSSPEGQDRSTSNEEPYELTRQLQDSRDVIHELPVPEYGGSGLLETLRWNREILHSKDLLDLPVHGPAPRFAYQRYLGKCFCDDPPQGNALLHVG